MDTPPVQCGIPHSTSLTENKSDLPKVNRVRDVTHDVRELELRFCEPREITFKAGQFISFEVPKEGFPYPITRPYSIASSPSTSDKVLLLFNLVRGPGSTYLFNLQEGDEVRFTGPAGAFYLRNDPTKRILCVATGTGIAPFCSIIAWYLKGNAHQPLILFWRIRSERDLYYQNEFQTLADRYPQFSCTVTLSQPGLPWTGARGRVSSLVEEQVTSVQDLAVYLCGNDNMIQDVTTTIQAKGLCPIYRERYY